MCFTCTCHAPVHCCIPIYCKHMVCAETCTTTVHSLLSSLKHAHLWTASVFGRTTAQRCGGRACSRAPSQRRGGILSVRMRPSRFYDFLEGLLWKGSGRRKGTQPRSGASKGRTEAERRGERPRVRGRASAAVLDVVSGYNLSS